jgi:taurine dioxygenase
MNSAQLEVKPLTGGMGAELPGIDLSDDMGDNVFAAVHQALLEHGAIFFHGQDITPGQQMMFAKRWGDIHLHTHALPARPPRHH